MDVLSHEQGVKLSSILEGFEQFDRSFQIAKSFLQQEELDPKLRSDAIQLAARSALSVGKTGEAAKFVAMLPPRALNGRLAKFALDIRIEKGDKESAFEFAKSILIRGANHEVLETAILLARETDQLKVIGDLFNTNPELLERLIHEGDQSVLHELGAYGFDFSNYISHFEGQITRSPKFYGGESRHD